MADEKRRTLKDILGELETAEKTHGKGFVAKDKDDITGLEQKIPIVEQNIVPMEETPPPVPMSVEKEPELKTPELEPLEDIAEQPSYGVEHKNRYSDSWESPQYVNKVEDFEQQIRKLEEETRRQKATIDSQKSEINEYREKLGALGFENKKLKSELSNAESNVKIDFEAQLNKAAIIEEKYNNLAKLHEEVKAKVRRDIRKIRTREKELANKLELMRHDSETLLAAKDHKILQLKQTIDNLEFEIETLKDKLQTLQEEAKETEEKAERVIKALRLSTSLLEVSKK